MTASPALLGYRERVVQERQRIAEHMLTLGVAEQSAWSKVKLTRRHLVGNSDKLFAWNSSSKAALYGLAILRGKFDFTNGFTATLARVDPSMEVVLQTFEIGRLPVHIGGDVFVAIDAVEPFVGGEVDPAGIRLIVFCGAGPEGSWPEGTVIGTEEEFNKK